MINIYNDVNIEKKVDFNKMSKNKKKMAAYFIKSAKKKKMKSNQHSWKIKKNPLHYKRMEQLTKQMLDTFLIIH